MKRIFALLILCCAFAFAQAPAGGSSVLGGIRTPLIVGGALGFGSGTGVGSERGVGLRQIEPMAGIWYPGLGYFRVGYGLFDYREESDEEKQYDVDHSELDFEMGVHLFSEVYLMGGYSRVKELSDRGDVAWNEWGAGFGSILFIFAKTLMFAEVGYRWVLSHYDPFLEKKVHGGRLQLNVGFAAYVF